MNEMRKLLRLVAALLSSVMLVALVPLFSLAAQEHPKTGAGLFEHVHALVVDAEGRALFLGAHTGLFRSEIDLQEQ
jgi:hypothetical protein